ncbi:MAG: hypothetical protein CM1200mP18_03190 [Gammaproteobacteria bacterium]|nr:MAG: hypothetical protein CM1200mP18_03190 [Gammaproteobacteria bacterium]
MLEIVGPSIRVPAIPRFAEIRGRISPMPASSGSPVSSRNSFQDKTVILANTKCTHTDLKKVAVCESVYASRP